MVCGTCVFERDDNPLDYLPSQRLSEYAEKVHFHGIRYPSAMLQGGTNIVFFSPAVCDFTGARLVKVTHLDIEYSDEVWRLTEEFPDI
jgi:hypothetical protein